MKTNELMPVPTQLIEGFYKDEVPENDEQKCPLILVLDTSSSMCGDPIRELNKGLKILQTQIQNNEVAAARLETAIVTFDSKVRVPRDFSLLEGTAIPTLEANGVTLMAEGIKEAIVRIEARKAWYRQSGLQQQHLKPYILLMTDGYPTSSPELVAEIKNLIQMGVDQSKFHFWAFGVGDANMDFLMDLSHKEFPPRKLKGFNFSEFFQWVSDSFSLIASSKPGDKIDLTPKPDANPFQITI